jgi:hypothetical protein
MLLTLVFCERRWCRSHCNLSSGLTHSIGVWICGETIASGCSTVWLNATSVTNALFLQAAVLQAAISFYELSLGWQGGISTRPHFWLRFGRDFAGFRLPAGICRELVTDAARLEG